MERRVKIFTAAACVRMEESACLSLSLSDVQLRHASTQTHTHRCCVWETLCVSFLVCLGAAVGLCGGETHLDLIVGVMLG